MNIIRPKFEILEQEPGIMGVYKAIELPGRICYGSMDKMTPDSAKPFFERLCKAEHGAPMEHGTVYLKTNNSKIGNKYNSNKFSMVKSSFDGVPAAWTTPNYYITTNMRVLFENGWTDDLEAYWSEPTQYHEKRVMVKFTIDRFTGEEYIRHRVASFNRESTRYVNFSKEKFGGGDIKFIEPCWLYDREDNETYEKMQDQKCYDYVTFKAENRYEDMCGEIFFTYNNNEDLDWNDIEYWAFALKTTEYCYNNLTRLGWTPQQARVVLPCAINSPLIKTAFVKDWIHFFNLRALGTTGAPHPQAKELAEPLMYEFEKRGLIEIKEKSIYEK